MKSLFNLSLAAIAFISLSAFAEKPNDRIDAVSSKDKNLFVFKTEKKFIGAKVEVVSASGDVITEQTLSKRKLIIDFCSAKFGTYTIRVSKDNKVKEFQYVKK